MHACTPARTYARTQAHTRGTDRQLSRHTYIHTCMHAFTPGQTCRHARTHTNIHTYGKKNEHRDGRSGGLLDGRTDYIQADRQTRRQTYTSYFLVLTS